MTKPEYQRILSNFDQLLEGLRVEDEAAIERAKDILRTAVETADAPLLMTLLAPYFALVQHYANHTGGFHLDLNCDVTPIDDESQDSGGESQ